MKEKVKVIKMHYHPEERITLLRTEVRTYPYLTPMSGYVVEKKCGDWILIRKTEAVCITVKKEDLGTPVYDIKSQICDFYHEEEMSYVLFERFCEDVRHEKVTIYVENKSVTIE